MSPSIISAGRAKTRPALPVKAAANRLAELIGGPRPRTSERRASEKRYRGLLEAAPDAMVVVNQSGAIVLLNLQAEKQFGYCRDELLGQQVKNIIPEGFAERLVADDLRSAEDAQAQQIGTGIELIGQRKDGSEFPIELMLSPLANADGILVTAAIRDVTERKESERALRRVNRALRALSGGNEVLVRATSEPELLTQMCCVIVELGGYRMAWIGIPQHDAEKSVRPVAWAGERTEHFTEQLQIHWGDDPWGRGTTGRAIRSGEPQISQDVAFDPEMSPWAAHAQEYGVASTATLPLKDDTGVFAVLMIYAAESNAFDVDEFKLLQELASDLAFGIRMLREHSASEALEERWRVSLESTVGAIASTVEMRDPYTAGHQRRVATLAVAIARRMSMSDHDVHGIYLAGIIHDVGKINVPAEILSKPGKLSAIEFQLIQTHSQAGYDIVKGVDFPWPIAQMVLQHHERLDGSGYPQGLKGDAMLGGAKILAVADVVEAMMSHRPYRPALGIALALAEIEKGKGSLFDPAVVDACIELFRRTPFALDQPAGAA